LAIAFTRCRVASLIRGLLLSALDTVAGDIPSALAMSTMLFSDFGFFGVILCNQLAAKATLFWWEMQMWLKSVDVKDILIASIVGLKRLSDTIVSGVFRFRERDDSPFHQEKIKKKIK